MKRSEINAARKRFEGFCRVHRFCLPPYRLLCGKYPPARD